MRGERNILVLRAARVTMIRVDTNAAENALAEAIDRCTVPEGFVVTRERLDVGDVSVTTEGGRDAVVFERKTWADLAASICDGRFKEQKSRMTSTEEETRRYVYVVEGAAVASWTQTQRGISARCMWSALVKTCLRDGMVVLHARGPEDAAALVCYVAEQLRTGGFAVGRGSGGGVVSGLSKRKRDHLSTPTDIFRAMLTTVPGMSVEKADATVVRFPTVHCLQRASERDVADLLVGKRRLGPKMASVLKSVFGSHGDSNTDGAHSMQYQHRRDGPGASRK
jgi:ERCC4-type nuclease